MLVSGLDDKGGENGRVNTPSTRINSSKGIRSMFKVFTNTAHTGTWQPKTLAEAEHPRMFWNAERVQLWSKDINGSDEIVYVDVPNDLVIAAYHGLLAGGYIREDGKGE